MRAINHRRFSSRNYVDHSELIKVNGNIEKKMFQHEDLLKSFVNKFEYGAKKDGYWSYEHLIIQLKNCIDVIKVIYGNKCIIQFMVDHSYGHNRKREHGLNINAIYFGHNGRQCIMHDSKMTEICLGEFISGGFAMIKVGDTKNMVFEPNDVGPYEILINER